MYIYINNFKRYLHKRPNFARAARCDFMGSGFVLPGAPVFC